VIINSELLNKLKAKRLADNKLIDENENYIMGRNPKILGEKAKKDPDNRIPIPWAKSAVEDLTSFAATPGNIKVVYSSDYKEIRDEVGKLNKDDLLLTELYNQALTHGEAYELHYLSDKLDASNKLVATPEYTMVDNREIVLIWDDNIKPELAAAIRFTTKGKVEKATVYKPFMATTYFLDEGSNVWREGDEYIYPYKKVPLSIYKINRLSQAVFEAEKSIIDANDNIVSKSTNEIDRFNTLVLMLGERADEDFVQSLTVNRVIDGLGDGSVKWPEYLKKDMTGVAEFYKLMMDKYQDEFHRNIKVPDLSDEQFAGNSSGVAMAFKLLGIENKAALIDAYFYQGIYDREELISQVLNSGTKKYTPETPIIESKRNIPMDLKMRIEMAEKLNKIVSRETLYKWLPNDIVDDVADEIKKFKKDELVKEDE